MISYAFRYAPIWQELQKLSANRAEPGSGLKSRRSDASRQGQFAGVLEVGSGAEGLALFWKGPLVGVDMRFKRPPMAAGVCASALHLPFQAGSFPVVTSCDMLEHLLVGERRAAVNELQRVAGERLLLGFPSGPAAWQLYLELAQAFGPSQPVWLREHLALGLPEADEVVGWLGAAGWQVEVLWYESAAAHKRLVWWERGGLARWFSYLITRCLGQVIMGRVTAGYPTAATRKTALDPMRVLVSASRAVNLPACAGW